LIALGGPHKKHALQNWTFSVGQRKAARDFTLYVTIRGDLCPVSYYGPKGEQPKIL